MPLDWPLLTFGWKECIHWNICFKLPHQLLAEVVEAGSIDEKLSISHLATFLSDESMIGEPFEMIDS